MAKVKLDRPKVFFDGEWIGDGRWIVRAEHIKVDKKKLQALLTEGTPFSWLGDDPIVPPENAPDLPKYVNKQKDADEQLFPTGVIVEHGGDIGRVRIYRAEKGGFYGFRDHYGEILELADLFVGTPDGQDASRGIGPAVLKKGDEIIGIVNPCDPNTENGWDYVIGGRLV